MKHLLLLLLVVSTFGLASCATAPPVADNGTPAEDTFVAFDEPPVLDKWIEPIYPEYAKQNNIEGMVNLRVTVSASGGVEDVKVMDSSDRMFDQPAIEAAREWRFKPARKDGRKVRATVMVPVRFRL